MQKIHSRLNMAPLYKLTYFDLSGITDCIRFLFSYGGIDFDDERISVDAKKYVWPQIKGTFPYGQVPILEHKGRIVNQSAAIARYVAKQVGLAGQNDWENLEIDAFVDTFTDFRLKMTPIRLEENPEKKNVLINTFLTETVPYYLDRFSQLVRENNGYCVCGRLTWADVYFVGFNPMWEQLVGKNILEPYPELVALRDKVLTEPNIKKWIDKHPLC